MKQPKFLMVLLIAIFTLSSCSDENITLQEDTVESIAVRASAPKPSLVNYNNGCVNGPQVKLKFKQCHNYATFYVNVFNSSGVHVYSWPVDNPLLNYNVTTSIGSSPFTFPDGTTTCSLLTEGQTYYLKAGIYDTMASVPLADSFFIPYSGCEC
jgi:hypothetical protein